MSYEGSLSAYRWKNAAGTPSADLVRKAAAHVDLRPVLFPQASPPRAPRVRRFEDSKERHGLRYGRLRGKEKGKEQALMTAACRNMKKVVLHPARVSWVQESLC
ncbi:hypothetical protein JF544_09365 [Halobacillus kuroshimensis]|uniref:Transposase DDE domain-containing protein n=1 Tax=Halobacillus kuroshimensis TaxID=302481 RepID=A0ABS3DVT4_9BACI|nr:hypothetical protein [Halobacillus kuroshimensis]